MSPANARENRHRSSLILLTFRPRATPISNRRRQRVPYSTRYRSSDPMALDPDVQTELFRRVLLCSVHRHDDEDTVDAQLDEVDNAGPPLPVDRANARRALVNGGRDSSEDALDGNCTWFGRSISGWRGTSYCQLGYSHYRRGPLKEE